MRKIDTVAFNKKIVNKIKELDALVKRISPENIKYFDTDLIGSSENYIKVLKECSWDGDSNFNGIEMHKVKDMLSHLKANRRKFSIERKMFLVPREEFDEARVEGSVTIDVPKDFDGRSSFVYPRFHFRRGGTINMIRPLENPAIKTTGKFMARKNNGAIDIEYLLYDSEIIGSSSDFVLWIDVFYILWR